VDDDEDLDDLGGDDDDTDLGLNLPKVDLEPEIGEFAEPESVEDDLDDDDLESESDSEPARQDGRQDPRTVEAGKGPSGSGGAAKPQPAEKHTPAVQTKTVTSQ